VVAVPLSCQREIKINHKKKKKEQKLLQTQNWNPQKAENSKHFFSDKNHEEASDLVCTDLPRNDYTYAIANIMGTIHGVTITQLPHFDLCFSLSLSLSLTPFPFSLSPKTYSLEYDHCYIRQRRHDHCVRPHENTFLLFSYYYHYYTYYIILSFLWINIVWMQHHYCTTQLHTSALTLLFQTPFYPSCRPHTA